MKAIAYVRVSSEKQAEFGVSLEAQIEKAKAMATLQGAELVDVIVDGGASAKSLERPGLQRLLGLVEAKKVNAVIVSKLDRLTRSVRDLADLLELFTRRGVSLVSVAESLDTATPAGRLVMNLMMSCSQWEREEIGVRTRCALQFKKSKGERVGNIPYGFRLAPDGKHIEPCPSEQTVVAYMRELREQGATFRAIASALNEKALRTRRGTQWHHVYVSGALRSNATPTDTAHS